MADGRFAKLTKDFVVAKLDVRNGRGTFAKELDVLRNHSYILILHMDPSRKITEGDESWHPFKEVNRLTNPSSMKSIRELPELNEAG